MNLDHLAALPERRAATDPAGACIADGRRELDNAGFATEVARLSARLAELGVGPGDVVAVVLPNCAPLITIMFACWRLGAAITPVNPALTASEVEYQVADSGANLVLVDDSSADKVPGCAAATVHVGELERSGSGAGAPRPRTELADAALLIYTSGTTGRPKGVVLDHANVAATAEMIVDGLELTPSDRCLLVLPLFHVNGIMVSVVSPLAAGASTVIAPRFEVASFWNLVERVRPTYFSAVPTIYSMLNALPSDVRPDISSLRLVICGAAPMPASAIRAFEDRYGVIMIEGYGQSEGTVVTTINPLRGVRKPGTVGLPLPGQEVRVVDADDNPLLPGEAGEVTVRGPNVMRGYLGKPEETVKTLRGGWLHTGDVGRLDEDGYLVLVDRVKDLIIRGGENIYPKEIENALYTHPSVFEAAVIGRPHELFGEEPVAFVAIQAGASLDAGQLVEHCQQTLARFKVPREVFLEEALPKNPVGKIDKPALRARFSTSPAGKA